VLTLGIQWTSVHTVQQYAECCEFSNSATRLQLSEALTQGIHSFLESPRDWSYWSMTLHVLTAVMSEDGSVLFIGLELFHQLT